MTVHRAPRTVLLAVLTLVGCARTINAAPRANRARAEALQQFSTFYRKTLEKHGILGSGIVVVSGREVIARRSFGVARRDPDGPVDDDTIFHYASITKTLTGIAIMQLRDRGLLKLDDPITKYIPELREVHDEHGSMDDITIRHLMTHTAGFRAPTWPWKSEKWQPHEPQHWEQLVAMFPYTEVQFEPGTAWSYSNLGVVFLGRVIELLSKDDYEVYIDKNIFKPLGMTRSYFDSTPYFLEPHKSHSFTITAGIIEPADPDVNTGITVSNGGLKAPLGDMAKYLQFLLGDPKRQERYDQVLARASLEEIV